MRFLVIAVLALLLVAPAWAQQGSGQVFGSGANCMNRFSCDAVISMSASALASSANTCVTQFFGFRNSDGFFDDMAGLDGNDCLTAKPDTIPKGMGAQLAPQCCIIKSPSDSTCSFRCEMVTQ